MKARKDTYVSKDVLFAEWAFFCIYWSVFAILWHFGTLLEDGVPGVSILEGSRIWTPIIALMFYGLGAVLIFGEFRGTTSSQSKQPSDTPHQNTT